MDEQILQKVTLLTTDEKFVHEGYILPLDPMPQVVIWGQRLFLKDPDKQDTYVEEYFAIVDFF